MMPLSDANTDLLDRIQNRVLWLAVQQIHYANHVRPKTDHLKVGGHQASCASVVTLMTMMIFLSLEFVYLMVSGTAASACFREILWARILRLLAVAPVIAS